MPYGPQNVFAVPQWRPNGFQQYPHMQLMTPVLEAGTAPRPSAGISKRKSRIPRVYQDSSRGGKCGRKTVSAHIPEQISKGADEAKSARRIQQTSEQPAEVCSLRKETSSLSGHVWELARDDKGTRLLQQALDNAGSDNARTILAFELRTHVWEALKCPFANHFLQKCISTLRPADSQFIIDELLQEDLKAVLKVARHQYGCRILQRLLEHCTPVQMHLLVESLLTDAVALSKHTYGNYVMQHLLEHGTESHIERLTALLAHNFFTVGNDNFGPAVLTKALEHAKPAQQMALAHALLEVPGLASTMAKTRHGTSAVKTALLHADKSWRAGAFIDLMGQREDLRKSRYGRSLVKFMEEYLTASNACSFDYSN